MSGRVRISIHAPLAGRDLCAMALRAGASYFNPRAPCGVRPRSVPSTAAGRHFQSTHPLRGATTIWRTTWQSALPFQSTHPLRGATSAFAVFSALASTFQSTRPLRGATSARWRRKRPRKHFNPRAPCGARPTFLASHRWLIPFQSTRPLRGATMTLGEGKKKVYISIHAPLAGRDAR